METILKINKKNPFLIDLPNKEKLELFLDSYKIKNNDKFEFQYHIFEVHYKNNKRLNFFTDKIIKFYIEKGFKLYTDLFSIDGNVIIKIKKNE